MGFPEAWRFDPLSALIGATVTGLGIGLLYLGRRPLRGLYTQVRERLAQVQQRLRLSAETQYRHWLLEQVPHWIAWSALDSRLAECLIEPSLIPPLPYPSPQVHERPEEPDVPLGRIVQAVHRLFLYGPPGSGRTSALCWLIREALRAHPPGQEPPAILPLYIRLPLLAPDPTAPPETALVEALSRVVPLVLRPRLSLMIRAALWEGSAFLLLDDLEEVPAPRRPEILRWLGRLLQAYPTARVVLAGDHAATRPLEELGFVPFPLALWSEEKIKEFIERWASIAGLSPSEQEALQKAWGTPRPVRLRPADVAAAAALKTPRPGDPALYDAMLERMLQGIVGKTALTMPAARLVLGQLALRLLNEERFLITLEDLEQALAHSIPELAPPAGRRMLDRAIEALTAPGRPIVPMDEERGHFRHPLIQAYLAAWALAQSGEGTALASHLDDPRWREVLDFYAAFGPMSGIIERVLTESDDAFHTRLRRMARWIAIASPQAPWRPQGLAALGRAFLKPGLPMPGPGVPEAGPADGPPHAAGRGPGDDRRSRRAGPVPQSLAPPGPRGPHRGGPRPGVAGTGERPSLPRTGAVRSGARRAPGRRRGPGGTPDRGGDAAARPAPPRGRGIHAPAGR